MQTAQIYHQGRPAKHHRRASKPSGRQLVASEPPLEGPHRRFYRRPHRPVFGPNGLYLAELLDSLTWGVTSLLHGRVSLGWGT